MSLFGSTINNLENALGYSSAKNKAISNNIANIDTPNYKAKDVAFNDVLKQTLSTLEAKRTNEKHLTFNNIDSSFRTINKNNTVYNHNGNNVDVDKEMADLAKNQIYYQSLVDRINGKFGSLQKVIRGGN
ncbi:flagellar basal body rod protein FlgB [Virgibacillus halodenitrificans]|uniref:flagellar basal body rod protein FlgB n=1 Tax=Virgibacillus halodenitrificans TaxID=1482 RepID=UPI00045C554A|nr:flagellar basal body rod protein FlgB [Virgibacillus halodenitrificans]MEC2160293.1 flagellar basal body rod protein FlgB [Virgibacillus halodenitrificans]MYL45956.1 flagellar basal body rod protein FlgB [Virgibacillus halodenitrificans]MYL58195.1 flagellar basal body rod protein FlgB [Virgibacillus halodenitrificans]WHX27156.1 flagellar basal body rod protein FlgB [Virgibacillus halodenitrificans]CDQ35852.1 Flagellar basal body rod protein FlgB [Virgibacillus halodenitrificans]